MNHIPTSLVFLGTNDPANNKKPPVEEEMAARVAAGEFIIKVEADARIEAYELILRLSTSDAWPENLPDSDIEIAINNYIEQSQLHGKCPFPHLVPDSDEPEDMYVRQHPTIQDMWLVIDSDQGTIYSSWGTEEQALCAAWDGQEGVKKCYAYFGIRVEKPENYTVRRDLSGYWGWALSEEGAYGAHLESEVEATIAAWKHKINSALITDASSGIATSYAALHQGLSCMVESGRLTDLEIPDDYKWLVESLACLGSRPDPQEILDRIHSILDGTVWESDTLNKVCMCLLEAGYSIRDVIEEG